MKILTLVLNALFSVFAILIGCSLIIWILYNEFINRLPEYERPPLAGPLGFAPAMIGVGIYWAKQVIGQVRNRW